ncbi:hypothetical protein BDV18DRAFT_161815 [Aspergillus unguis]
MLGKSETRALDASLDALRENDQKYRNDLQQVLGQFRFLLDSYNRLRDDYKKKEEELRQFNATKQSKIQESRTQSGTPFVLVLVDGDGYLFQESLIRNGEKGGKKAATLLREYIAKFVYEVLGIAGSDCEVMVRVYSNLLNLSENITRTGMVGKETRSLSTFVSSFSASQPLFDFVDTAGASWHPVDKIRQNLELFIANEQCKHIFFAACHDRAYMPLLSPYCGRTDRITLIKAASFCARFYGLGLHVRELPSLFMSKPITKEMTSSQTIISSPTVASPLGICKFEQKGNCRSGDRCKYIHTKPWSNSSDQSASQSTSSTRYSKSSTRDDTDYATLLPSPTFSNETISVNKHGDRIDPYCPLPPSDEWDSYAQQIRKQKLCSTHYLAGSCTTKGCTHYHGALSFDPYRSLKFILRRKNCAKGPRCRSVACMFGHHCQKGGCPGGKRCRFDRYGHELDLAVATWEVPQDSSTREGLEEPTKGPSFKTPSQGPAERQAEPSLIDFDF